MMEGGARRGKDAGNPGREEKAEGASLKQQEQSENPQDVSCLKEGGLDGDWRKRGEMESGHVLRGR